MNVTSRPRARTEMINRLEKRFSAAKVPPFELHMPDERFFTIGEADQPPAFRVYLRTDEGVKALKSLDEEAVGLAYLHGDIDVEGDFLAALDLRTSLSDRHPLASAWRFVYPLLVGQVKSNRRWVPQHYDYGNDFYFSFLDKNHRLYSQALYRDDGETIEQAAQNKLQYIVDVCRLGPGSHVLDVGGGWGSFGQFAAARGIDVTMLTLSHEQLAFLSELSSENHLPGRLVAKYSDIFAYSPGERYDAIVLLGVMEHLPDYHRLFRKFEELLNLHGRVYMDFSASRRKFAVSTFTYRYVFPGNHTPVLLPDLLAAANKTRFEPFALHNDRHSYFLTLRAWARNLEAAHAQVAERFGEQTFRLFQLYLWAGAHQMHRDGALESYRAVFQCSYGHSSDALGPYRPM